MKTLSIKLLPYENPVTNDIDTESHAAAGKNHVTSGNGTILLYSRTIWYCLIHVPFDDGDYGISSCRQPISSQQSSDTAAENILQQGIAD